MSKQRPDGPKPYPPAVLTNPPPDSLRLPANPPPRRNGPSTRPGTPRLRGRRRRSRAETAVHTTAHWRPWVPSRHRGGAARARYEPLEPCPPVGAECCETRGRAVTERPRTHSQRRRRGRRSHISGIRARNRSRRLRSAQARPPERRTRRLGAATPPWALRNASRSERCPGGPGRSSSTPQLQM
jgi:hypothetical protein